MIKILRKQRSNARLVNVVRSLDESIRNFFQIIV